MAKVGEFVVSVALLALALASTAWTVFFSVHCLGGGCTPGWEDVAWFGWLSMLATLIGAVLMVPRRTRYAAWAVMAVPPYVAVAATFTGAFN